MSTTWTLPVSDVIDDALEIIGELATGQTASADQFGVALKALNAILKELPIHGVVWPKVTADPVALTWDAGTPSKIALPADYYGAPAFSYVDERGGNVSLEVITKAAYDALPNKAQTGSRPTKVYIAPNNSATLWPVPESDPALTLTYQAIASDADIAAQPDVAQAWIGGMGLWLAYELCPKFQVDLASRADIEKRFLMRRNLMLAYAAESAPITFTVDNT
jgi:hypothetical protein